MSCSFFYRSGVLPCLLKIPFLTDLRNILPRFDFFLLFRKFFYPLQPRFLNVSFFFSRTARCPMVMLLIFLPASLLFCVCQTFFFSFNALLGMAALIFYRFSVSRRCGLHPTMTVDATSLTFFPLFGDCSSSLICIPHPPLASQSFHLSRFPPPFPPFFSLEDAYVPLVVRASDPPFLSPPLV